MFESINSIDLKSYQTLPDSVEFKLTDFEPQPRRFENMFGEPPVLKIEYKKKSSVRRRNSIKAFDLTTGNWLPSVVNINSDSSDEDVIIARSFKSTPPLEYMSDHSNPYSSDSDGVTVSSATDEINCKPVRVNNNATSRRITAHEREMIMVHKAEKILNEHERIRKKLEYENITK